MPEDTRPLTTKDMEAIANAAADRALEKVYGQIGKSLVTRIFWLAGVAVLGFAAAKGWFTHSSGGAP
ncbi:MAG: hypothetical protein LW854_08580 [Rubrivivax sp.]|jgi:hypothetical protein|nr:hypothetical protein [Rubrivivax sp.]